MGYINDWLSEEARADWAKKAGPERMNEPKLDDLCPPGWRWVHEQRDGKSVLHMWSPPTERHPHGKPVTFTSAGSPVAAERHAIDYLRHIGAL